jgi:hypothetical protein
MLWGQEANDHPDDQKNNNFAGYFENKTKNCVFFFKRIKILNLSLRLQK